MNGYFHRRIFLPLLLMVAAGISVSLRAQPAPAPSAPASGLPVLQPPLSLFRELLAMTAAQREQRLALWTPEKRDQLKAKIHEYESMTPEARDQSMAATELHWYLQHFISNQSTNDAVQLSQVPEPYRGMVSDRLTVWKILPPQLQQDIAAHDTARDLFSDRLAVWKILPPQLQQEILTHESTRDFFLLGNRASIGPEKIIPPPLREELDRLDALQPGRRQQAYANFHNFFALTSDEKRAVLDALTTTERQQFEKTIADIERLPAEQRALALRSLSQLAGLPDQQRLQFFNSVSRWKQLPPIEQKLWLEVAGHLPPPPAPSDLAIIPPR